MIPSVSTIRLRLTDRGVRTSNGCLEWTGHRGADGYGVVKIEGVNYRVHRLSWHATKGPIPDGMCVCHRCDNRPCFDDAHLFLGTRAENNADKWRKGRAIFLPGEKNGRAKITADQVRDIRADRRILAEIARSYGLGISQIHRIKTGERWRDSLIAAEGK